MATRRPDLNEPAHSIATVDKSAISAVASLRFPLQQARIQLGVLAGNQRGAISDRTRAVVDG